MTYDQSLSYDEPAYDHGHSPDFSIYYTDAERKSLLTDDNYFSRVKESDRAYAFWLVSVPWIGMGPVPKLLQIFGSPKEIYKATDKELNESLENRVNLEQLLQYRKANDIFKKYDELISSGIKISFIFDDDYPVRLKSIPDPPYAIFYYGSLPENNKLAVAVIGARQCSEYGIRIARELGKALGKNDINLISGMATGIDGISQKAAVSMGGRSFAVLGSGPDICYPESNYELYCDLIKTGGVISAYPPGTGAQAAYFPPRNRIVSGLSDVVVVVEARSRSGTLITVDMALEQGRDIYAVPGRLGDELSAGCNGLIGHGARICLSPEIFMKDLLEDHASVFEYSSSVIPVYNSDADIRHRKYSGSKETEPPLSENELYIYRHLSLYPKSAEDINNEIVSSGGTSPGETGICLMLMEMSLEGYVMQISPGYFCK